MTTEELISSMGYGWKYETTESSARLVAEHAIETMYSEEDMKFAYEQGARLALISQSDLSLHKGEFPNPDEWFEQFKKK
jgi:hypothetical protein